MHMLRNVRITRTQFWCIVAMLAVVSMSISLAIGVRQSIWFDEAYSIFVSKTSPVEIIRLVGLDTHPPLYYLLLHVVGQLSDWQTTALRVWSVIWLGGSVLLAAALAKRLSGPRAGLVAALFVSLAPLLIRYGFEIRMYSLASCIGLAATYVLVRAREADASRRWWLLYAVLVATGMYTLYYLALLWVTHALWLWWVSRKQRSATRLFRQPWMLAYGVAIVLFLPWLPTFLKQTTNGALAPIGRPMNLEQLIGVLSFNALYKPLWQLDMLDTLLVIEVFVMIVVLSWRMARQLKKSARDHLLLMGAYMAVPIVVLMIVSFVRSMYVERYLSHIAVGFLIYIAIIVSIGTRRRMTQAMGAVGFICVVLMLGISNLASVGNFNFQRMSRGMVDQAAASVVCGDSSAIVAADPYVMIELSAYLSQPQCTMYFYSPDSKLGGGYAPLSGSAQQLKALPIPALARDVYYVHYDKPSLEFSGDLKLVSTTIFENLSVTHYSTTGE